ncbi:MAG: hypothetical protein ABSE69_00910 [Roseiarcus sp.]|jgi:hypothetical protein
MSFVIPGIGRILASHAASGVSVSAPATQTLSNLTKNIHADASQLANQTRFAEVFNATRATGRSGSTAAPLAKP